MLTTTVYPNRRGRSRCSTSMAGKAVGISILVVVMVLLLGSAEAFAQFNWTKYPGNPVFPGQPGTWYAYVSLSSVLYNADSSRYEMWFTAGAQIEFPYTIGYAWSDNGISWTVYDSHPVLTPTPSEWDAYTTFDPFVLRENGQYKMWYVGIETTALLSRIGYATSQDGINWTKHQSNPVLEPGTASWESAAVSHPSVMPYSNGYKMWYSGSSAVLQTAIGYATSPDGINWQKDTLNNPVLLPGAGGQWDHLVYGPEVCYIDNLYYMFYNGMIVLYQSDQVGLATSADGLVWTKYPSNPVLQPTAGQWDGSRTEIGSVLMDADTLKMYYSGTNGSNWDIGLATSPFLPDVLLPGTYTVPVEFALDQNYPNPFNPNTNIEFQIPNNEYVTLKIYNLLGEEIATLVSGQLVAGSYSYNWDASELASGIYFYRLYVGSLTGEARGFVQTRKMILMR